MLTFYASHFVTEPFEEVVDGRMCKFTDMDFINGVKTLAESLSLNLDDVVRFIDNHDGWFGIYGEYMTPEQVIDAFRKEN